MVGKGLMLYVEVGNTNPHSALDDDDFSEGGQFFSEKNVEIFAGRPFHLDDAAGFERQNLGELHPAAVELHLDLDPDVADVGDFFLGSHYVLGRLLKKHSQAT